MATGHKKKMDWLTKHQACSEGREWAMCNTTTLPHMWAALCVKAREGNYKDRYANWLVWAASHVDTWTVEELTALCVHIFREQVELDSYIKCGPLVLRSVVNMLEADEHIRLLIPPSALEGIRSELQERELRTSGRKSGAYAYLHWAVRRALCLIDRPQDFDLRKTMLYANEAARQAKKRGHGKSEFISPISMAAKYLYQLKNPFVRSVKDDK